MVMTVLIGSRSVGMGQPCFVIAEVGVNHCGDLGMARQLVDAAAEAGADAVKFQTFCSERLVVARAPKAEYQRRTTNARESQCEMLRQLELSHEAHKELQGRCRQKGVVFLSSPFEEEGADFLRYLGVPAFKIPSGEITNTALVEHVARFQKPLILSTGMATLDEVDGALQAARRVGNEHVILLQCTSAYPAQPDDVNLRAMHTLRERFGVPAGFSDHTTGIEIALAAVALGACVIEKHLTLDCSLSGPDHAASIEPATFRELVKGIRKVELSLGDGIKQPVAAERSTAVAARKSLVAACDIAEGQVVTRNMISVKRPGTGLAPTELVHVVGRRAVMAIKSETLLSREMFR